MSFTLSFPNRQDAEPYTGLIEEHEVYEAVCEEVRKSISDMGGDGYEPSDFLPDDYNSDNDQDGEKWNEATTKAIEHEVTMWTPQIFETLWLRYPAGEPERGPVTTSKLPDGVTIKLEEVED